jgi:hypothetical protein
VLIISAMNAAIHSNSGKVPKSLIIAVSVISWVAIAAAIVAPYYIWNRHPCRTPCVMLLRSIEGAKATWALEQKKLPTDTPTDADLFGRNAYIYEKPTCPQGGTYTLGKVGEKPRCSFPGHRY